MSTSGACVLTSLALVTALFSVGACDDGSGNILEIQVLNGKKYTDKTWFSHHFANVPSEIKGHLGQVMPRNACGYIDLLNSTSETWFALVSDYPSCSESMVVNVRNAGYKLIITSSNGDSHRNVYKSLCNTNFPIVVVKTDFAGYLDHALSNSSNGTITLHITTDHTTPVVVITVVCFVLVTCCCCMCCCICVCCCVHGNRRNGGIEGQFERQRRDLERQQQRHERLARQELIQSILRQLQELQLDLRQQVPLGQADTERLPQRKYKPGIDTCEACAICVDDFSAADVVRVLPCGHVFHPQCIDEWLINHSSLCPLCKMELPRQQEQGQQEQLDGSDFSINSDSPLLPRRRNDSPMYGSF